MFRVIHYPPAMGLRPRPADDYDLLCLRFFLASNSRNVSRAMNASRELLDRFGADCADDAYGHGQMLADCKMLPQ